MISQFLGEDAKEKANLNSGDKNLGKPVLIYITNTDQKEAKRLKAWEESRLVDEKLMLAVRLFRCYTVDIRTVPKDHEFRTMVKKTGSPAFIVVKDGDIFATSGKKPSSSKILSVLKKGAKKLLGISMDKIIKKGMGLKKERDKIKAAKDEVDKKLKGLKKGDRRVKKYQEELAELNKKDTEFVIKENELYDVKMKD